MPETNNAVKIEGVIEGKDLTEEQFLSEFLIWLESKGWFFGGITDDIY